MALRRYLWLVLVCTFVVVLLTGCSVVASEPPTRAPANEGAREVQPAPDTPEPLIIEQRVAPRGQEFEIRLQGNPTTGYGWQVTEIDAQKVQMLAEDYVEHKQEDQPIVGAGGTYIFRFRASAEGQTRIVIVYQRPWEKDVDPLRTYTLDLTVR
jgi:predicted secreted protein